MVRLSSEAAANRHPNATYRIREEKRAITVRREEVGIDTFHIAQEG
jgi:hypothetical protein